MKELIWGGSDAIKKVLMNREDNNGECFIPDVIIGADVVLWPNFLKPLFFTLRHLLSLRPTTSVAYISYVVRAHSVTELLFDVAEELGLSVEEIDPYSFLPNELPDSLASIEKRFFAIRIKEPGIAVDIIDLIDDYSNKDSYECEFMKGADAPY